MFFKVSSVRLIFALFNVFASFPVPVENIISLVESFVKHYFVDIENIV